MLICIYAFIYVLILIYVLIRMEIKKELTNKKLSGSILLCIFSKIQQYKGS